MRIYQAALELVGIVVGLAKRVQVHDADLARQLRRAVVSVPLNIAEGMYGRGGNKVARYSDAMGSAKETMAGLEVSVCAQYLAQEQVADALGHIDHIVGGLWRLCNKPRR